MTLGVEETVIREEGMAQRVPDLRRKRVLMSIDVTQKGNGTIQGS